MEKAWGMIKCLGFDKSGAWYFFSESNGALLNSWMLKKMQTSNGNLQMSAFLQARVLMVWGQVLVSLQLKCARGMLAGGGGCPSPAPCAASQRHTQTHTVCCPKPWMGQALDLAPPPKHQRKAPHLGPMLTQRSVTLSWCFSCLYPECYT